jgi:hypothetical protein
MLKALLPLIFLACAGCDRYTVYFDNSEANFKHALKRMDQKDLDNMNRQLFVAWPRDQNALDSVNAEMANRR